MTLYKTAFSAGDDQAFVIFALGPQLLSDFQQNARVCQKQRFHPRSACTAIFALGATRLRFFQQVHEFVENSVSSPRSAGTVIFALGAPLINSFQQSAGVCPKSKTAFLARDQHVLSFSHCAHHLLVILSKVHKFGHNSVFSPRSAGIVIFALCAPLFNSLQQSARVCPKQRFQPEISTFCHFCTGSNTFQLFSAKCTGLYKTAFSALDHHVLSF